MIELNTFRKIMNDNEDRLPLLTLDEFFEGNTAEDSIAPNECDFGRPSLAQIWDFLQKIEELPNIAWVRVSLHNDTEIAKYDGEEVLELWGDTIVVCTSVPEEELEELMKCQWLCSGGAEECDIADLDSLFSCRPPVPDGFRCFEIVWD